MTLRITRLTIVIVACALLTWGCRSKGNDHGRHASSAAPVGSWGNQQAIRLSGCVELSGTGMADYVLQRVHVESTAGQDPHRATNNPTTGAIVEGSWVRLSGARDLRALAGHRVEVSGVLVDPGEKAVGTTAIPGVVLPSGDVSRAATDEPYRVKLKKEAGPIAGPSIAAGAAPEIRVIEIRDLGQTCHEASHPR